MFIITGCNCTKPDALLLSGCISATREDDMAKALFIAEKPSVAQEFAKALGETMRRGDGFVESDSYVVTWCVGHLVTMSYPEVYDPKYQALEPEYASVFAGTLPV